MVLEALWRYEEAVQCVKKAELKQVYENFCSSFSKSVPVIVNYNFR